MYGLQDANLRVYFRANGIFQTQNPQQEYMIFRFVFKYWLATLLLAPCLLAGYEWMIGKFKGQVMSYLEFLPVILIFSFILSLPTLLLCYLTSLVLLKKRVHQRIARLTLIGLTVGGIVLTIQLLGGSLGVALMSAYSAAAILSGAFLSMRTAHTTPPSTSSSSR